MLSRFASSVTLRTAAALALGALGGAAAAAVADIPDTPIDTAQSVAIRPNVMFVLDDSGSMDYEYLPDAADYTNLCFGDSRINRIFYDPNLTYLPPLKADGSSYLDAVFAAAPSDGYVGGGGKDLAATIKDKNNADVVLGNLNTPITQVAVKNGNAVKSKFYYARYTPAGSAICSGKNYKYTDFTIVTASAAIEAPAGVNALTNYANWYSYYRTRMLTMRSAAGRVFASIDASRFRVGFSTIHDIAAIDGPEFLNIDDFDKPGQKAAFFTKLYDNGPNRGSPNDIQYTPLRPALNKAGRYFANKAKDQAIDPVQYSCQRNYTILSTDGYWNLSDEPAGWNKQLANANAIGNQDGPGLVPAIARPQLDDVKANGSTGGAGILNTLADIAMYYYMTDLRDNDKLKLNNCTGGIVDWTKPLGPRMDVCTNNVSPVKPNLATGDPGDPATYQHMNTITLGLGVSGTLNYDPNYWTQAADDYFKIVNGVKAWPDPKPTDVSASVITRIDDLWHAAVNGRGKYYSANDPVELANSLTDALDNLAQTFGAGAAAATSNLQPVAGDNFLFLATYWTQLWTGSVEARTVDPSTGAVSAASLWDASTQLKAKVAAAGDTRNIYFFKAGAANNLASFTYANLAGAGMNANFDDLCPAVGKLSQCVDVTVKAAVNGVGSGAKLVDYLRGRSGYEDTAGNALRLFRNRTAVLGDIINSIPVYVKKPAFTYADAGYADFASANAARQGVVYTGANDGMLHAFNADTGAELWAYVPSPVIGSLYKLADFNYANKHQYYVDGAPTIGDVHDAAGWHTILVGGLNKGGKSYYALDVTDPANPKALWEFSDGDLGYSFGNPVITKLKNGTWVVIFSSGYNNSGLGYLYVRNALTGAAISKLATSEGSFDTPSNLGAINVWVDRLNDNTAKRVYGGDMLGNLWRFDIDDNIAAGSDAFLLAQARLADGTKQPITTRPELSEIKAGATRYPLVSIGTGRYLGGFDVTNTDLQSVYTFKDTLNDTALGNLHTNAGMVEQTLAASADGRTISNPVTVDWATKNGWYVDLKLSTGERVNVDMQQQLGILSVATNVPDSTNVCALGGSSWLYYFDIGSGSFVSTSTNNVVATFLGNELTEGLTRIQKNTSTTGGTNDTATIIVTNKGKIITENDPPPAKLNAGARRVSWRELAN